MKRKMLFLAVLAALMLASAALAEWLVDDDYTDAPTAMTQDSVLSLKGSEDCNIETLLPDAEAIALLDDVYHFVWEDKNRPARYYDEETQRKITALIGGGDIDHLHMTEAMRLQLTGEPGKAVTAEMLLDVEYRVGQLIVVVLGIPQGDGEYVWYPYRGRVETECEIKWDIPVADWAALCRQPVSFHVLTDRIGPRGGRIWYREEYSEQTPPSFSKDSDDVRKVRHWYDEWGNRIEDNFRLWLVELTKPMQEEVARIGEHLAEGGAILDYFPEERREEALLMLPEEVDPATLIPYDVIALRDEEYKDTYGDVTAEFIFATAYQPEKRMVVLAGFPIEDATEAPWVEWYVLRAEAIEPERETDPDYPVEIGLKQLNLPRMEEEPMMLVVISEPIDQE